MKYLKIEDKSQGKWIVAYINSDGDGDIVATCKTKWLANDVVMALNSYFEENPKDGIDE